MRPQLSLTRINGKLQRLNAAGLVVLGAITVIGVGLNRLTLALRPEERPSDAELVFVQEAMGFDGESVSEREVLDHLSDSKRLIAKGYKLCKSFERQGYRGKPDRLEEVLLGMGEEVHAYGMAALNNLCPGLKGEEA